MANRPSSSQPFHQPELPQRLVPVEGLREEPPGEPLELLVAARRRQRRVAHVILDVELGLVDPDRAPLLEGYELHPLPVARHLVEAGFDELQEVPVRRGLSVEHGDRPDVHVAGAILELEEERIQRAEPLEPRAHGA